MRIISLNMTKEMSYIRSFCVFFEIHCVLCLAQRP